MLDLKRSRNRMVERDVAARGVTNPVVLAAMRTVPREHFVAEDMVEFAYEDSPLPIECEQTISQPYIVALMAQLLRLKPGARVLEIGTGSGYAAAVLGKIAAEVYTVERHGELAGLARGRFQRLGYDNIHVLHGDGTLGWPEYAPYDGIVVAAGGPSVPKALMQQLKLGGNLVIPVGEDIRTQRLLRVTRVSEEDYHREDLGGVRFVQLIGQEGWAGEGPLLTEAPGTPSRPASVAELIAETCEPFGDIESANLDALIDRIGDARVVLMGEATHGTSEFYRMRSRLTRELIRRKGFSIVSLEADWPDAARVDAYVRHLPPRTMKWRAFDRFPVWMWRNHEFRDLVEWLREHNEGIGDPERRVGLHGLDMYSLFTSMRAVIDYLDRVDPEAARVARRRYGCLSPWERDPAVYGRATLTGKYRLCEDEVVKMLRELLERRLDYSRRDGEIYFDAVQNARLIRSAEQYYRIMYYGSRESWNLRDGHMFETLQGLLAHRGPEAKAIVWAHNSHVGDAAATEMGARGEENIGSLCREAFGPRMISIGFGTDSGTVAAATEWGGPMEIKNVRPSHPESYERLAHDSGVRAFLLALRQPKREEVREELMPPRLERAIGVIYRPESELASHYFQASLPRQFDEYIWFDRTEAVRPLGAETPHGVPDTWPFGL